MERASGGERHAHGERRRSTSPRSRSLVPTAEGRAGWPGDDDAVKRWDLEYRGERRRSVGTRGSHACRASAGRRAVEGLFCDGLGLDGTARRAEGASCCRAELLREGSLDEALDSCRTRSARTRPTPNTASSCSSCSRCSDEWDRALTQLNVLGRPGPASLAMVQTYREALAARLCGRRSSPGALSPGLRRAAALDGPADRGAEADRRRPLRRPCRCGSRLSRRRRPRRARSTAQPFEWIADGDTRLGPVLEAIVNGRYYWIPFDRIRRSASRSRSICATWSGCRRSSLGQRGRGGRR